MNIDNILNYGGTQKLEAIVRVVEIAVKSDRADVNSNGVPQFDVAATLLYDVYYKLIEDLRDYHKGEYDRLNETLLKLFGRDSDK